jgi:type IV secretion system protein VirD4
MNYLRPLTPSSNAVLGDITPHAIYFGRHIDHETNRVGGRMLYSGERHWIVFGPNGSGKSMRLLVPNLLQCAFRSFFVIDVKGQLAAITAAYRAQLGPVYVINPYGLWADDPRYPDLKSCGYNPLAKLDPSRPDFNSEAALLAEALITVEDKQPHWGLSGRNLLAMLIMYVVLEARGAMPPEVSDWVQAAQIPPPDRPGVPTMARVRQLLCLDSEPPAKGNNYKGAGVAALALAVQFSGNDGLINLAGQFMKSNDEKASVFSTAQAQTQPFDDPEIAADMAMEGPDFRTLKDGPATVFLVLPPKHIGRHDKWLRLLVSQAMYALMDEPKGGQPPALFILEEIAALGHLDVIEKTYALVRDYKIQIVSVWQDMSQLQRIYKAGWQTMVSNTGIVTSFGTNDLVTAEWFSERSGETSRTVSSFNSSSTRSQNPGQFGEGTSQTSSFSETPTKTRLAHRHSLFGMAPGATVNFIAGEPNIVLGFAPMWTKIRQCKDRGRDNPYWSG